MITRTLFKANPLDKIGKFQGKNRNKFYFNEKLLKATILDRKNRFVMTVKTKDEKFDVYVPVTGAIFNLNFAVNDENDHPPIHCLLSKTLGYPKTKYKYCVDAISIDAGKSYIGINQGKVNRYIELFLKNGVLDELILNPVINDKNKYLDFEIRREVAIAQPNNLKKEIKTESNDSKEEIKIAKNSEVLVENSKLDFLIKSNNDFDHFLEVKAPMNSFKLTGSHARYKKPANAVSNITDRLVRHFEALRLCLISNQNTHATIITAFMYDAEPFLPLKSTENLPENNSDAFNRRIEVIRQAANKSYDAGLQRFQVNFKINEYFLELTKIINLQAYEEENY